MGANSIIVSASSKEYFFLLAGMILSVESIQQQGTVDIGILDLGLSPQQCQWLEKRGVHVVIPNWECGIDESDKLSIVYKGLLARPFIPKYFSGYDKYWYIDADAWMQEPKAAEHYLTAIESSVIAIAPEVHRAYENNYLFANEYRAFVYECYEECCGKETAEQYGNNTLLNAGVFAIPCQSPVWNLWKKNLTAFLKQTRHHAVEQTALNLALLENFDFSSQHEVTLLPATDNWLCHLSMPTYHDKYDKFVEPCVPYESIGIIHRSSDKFKAQPKVTITTQNQQAYETTIMHEDGKYIDTIQELCVLPKSGWQNRGDKRF